MALIHQGLIVCSAVAISIETMPEVPAIVSRVMIWFEIAVLAVFVVEYITRVVCARRPLRYVFSFWGIVDLLACAPILMFLDPHWAVVRILRLLRLMRLFKLMHTNTALLRLQMALEKSRSDLAVFAFLAIMVLYIAAVGIYIFEYEAQPEKFSSIPKSLWWAVVSFTTVGYGDMYPITAGGRLFTCVVLFVGLGVIAVPTAVITSALIHSEMEEKIEREVEEELRDSPVGEMRRGRAALRRQPKRRP